MASIKKLRDINGNAVYPQTVTSAIYSENNENLEMILASKATKEEVDNRFDNFSSLDIQIVDSLPAEGSSTSIYLLQVASGIIGNLYEEYLYVNNKWEMIGAKEVDLSEYATKSSLASVATSGNFNELNNKPAITTQNTITNFWVGTQADYNAITTKEVTTLYLITG